MVRVTEFRYEQNTYLAYCGLFIIKKIINALAKNSPQDCFLNARLQVPSSLAGKIKEQLTQVLVAACRKSPAYAGLFAIFVV